MASGGFTLALPPGTGTHESLATLGLLNSRVLFWFLRHVSNRFRGGWITCTKQYVGQLPIIRIRPEARLRRMAGLVGEIVGLYARGREDHEEPGRPLHRRSLEALESAIEDEVCSLYGLTDQEANAIRAASAREPVHRS